ncbi:unnamed protein product [Ambrosiozyma monospora]|uniref:Unnamed protein product n=1 Tax=Ambrosiozyma monospora TaxID=43982 RepID=A0A9W6T0N9_AMBMO|nr:unnamed protein product [Ambrosiozyma monospora]
MYESVSTCFSLAANTRRRDILRSTAETTLINITQKMFSKLKDIESTHDDHNVKGTSVELTTGGENGVINEDTIGGTEPAEVPETPETPENTPAETPVNATIEEKEAEAANEVPIVVEEPSESKPKSESNSDITVDENGHVSIASRFDDDTPFGLPT